MSKYGRVAVYYRVSTDKQDFDSQEVAVKDWIAANGVLNATFYSDFALSGTDSKRPKYQQLISDMAHGEIDTLIVFRLDRLTRKSSEAIRLVLNMRDDWAVDFISLTQPHMQSRLADGSKNPMYNTFIAISSDLAEIERDGIVERIKSGIAAAKARGVQFGPPPKITPELLELALALRAGGKSYREIAHQITEIRATRGEEKPEVTHTSVYTAIRKAAG
jgi:DNA invertase Pin-like site-specific DNA recombinase